MLIFYKNFACLHRTGILVHVATLGICILARFFRVHLIKQTSRKEPNKFDISRVAFMWSGILCTLCHFMLTTIVL